MNEHWTFYRCMEVFDKSQNIHDHAISMSDRLLIFVHNDYIMNKDDLMEDFMEWWK